MRQILIGITCNYLAEVPDAFHAGIGAKEQAWQLIAQDYLDAVWKAGGIPVLIPIDREADRACGILNTIDGLIISGGNDVSPSLYGERVTCCGSLDPERDRYEMELLKKALEMDLPVLGVCRGIQIMNVFFGGTLHQDVVTDGLYLHSILTNRRNVPVHSVVVEEDTLLGSILGSGKHWVNSLHHQAVKDLAPALVASAKTEEGIAEGVELPGKKFVAAVQWHPEMMYDDDTQQGIFRAFLKACEK